MNHDISLDLPVWVPSNGSRITGVIFHHPLFFFFFSYGTPTGFGAVKNIKISTEASWQLQNIQDLSKFVLLLRGLHLLKGTHGFLQRKGEEFREIYTWNPNQPVWNGIIRLKQALVNGWPWGSRYTSKKVDLFFHQIHLWGDQSSMVCCREWNIRLFHRDCAETL